MSDNTLHLGELSSPSYRVLKVKLHHKSAYKDFKSMINERIEAVAILLGLDEEEKEKLQVSSYDENIIEYYSEEYEVLTDDEADDRWEQELDNYLEECIYPELPDFLGNYFDEEAWKRDARFDGRGHAISRYNGNEKEVNVNDTYYYVYRQN